VIAKRSEKEATAFAKKHPQIGRISLYETFDAQDSHSITGKIIFELLGNVWLRLHQKKLKEGQAVCRADDVSDSLILVTKGNVDVYAPDTNNNRVLLENVGIYDVMGEQTFFKTSPLGFDAFVSSESAAIVKVPRKKIASMLTNNQHLRNMLTQRARFRHHVRIVALHPIFKTLPLKLSKYLARHLSSKIFPEKSMIFSLQEQIDGVYIILSGKACYLAKNKQGKKFALSPLKLNSLVGDLLLHGKKSEQSNELFAASKVSIIRIPHEHLLNISTAFPPLMERLMQHAEQQQQQIIHSLSQIQHE
jgi:CRP-like cAMP-binding protein